MNRLVVWAALMLLIFLPNHAQAEIILTVSMPDYQLQQLDDTFFDAFETAHPGVRVEGVGSSAEAFPPQPQMDFEGHLSGLETYVTLADVVAINWATMNPIATAGGYYLDLAPLVNTDSTFNPDQMMPAVWQSYQWDGGIWALPYAYNPILITYNPAAFDSAGLAYPTASWSLTDYLNAARTLTTYDENGSVAQPGLISFDRELLWRALVGQSFADDLSFPAAPRLALPELAPVLTEWAALESEGIIGYPTGMLNSRDVETTPPMWIADASNLAQYGGPASVARGSLLPGGVAGLRVEAFAVSAGTQHPELAYALARYMTENPLLINVLVGVFPANEALSFDDLAEENLSYTPTFAPEDQAVIDAALQNALPVSDLRYARYLDRALMQIQGGESAESALQAVEQTAREHLRMAQERRPMLVVSYETAPELPQGEIALSFGISLPISPLPNEDAWQQVAERFAANDPQVGYVDLENRNGASRLELSQDYDCYFTPSLSRNDFDVPQLLNLDPFLETDPNFDLNDFLPGALEQLQSEGRTWGLPMIILPTVLEYDKVAFEAAGVQATATWTPDMLVDTLHRLRTTHNITPFGSGLVLGAHVNMLIASFGGLPLDYRQSPPISDFPGSIDAIRAVLDLAKEGYINYERLGVYGGGLPSNPGGFIRPTNINWYDAQYRYEGNGMLLYPQGTAYNPMAFEIGAGYISANTAYPEACYRWLDTLSREPNLFNTLPARHSVRNMSAYAPEEAALYETFVTLLDDPNTVRFPMPYSDAKGFEALTMELWLHRAYDRYVLENADLESELALAQEYADAFMACAAGVDPAGDLECAVQVDPTLREVFGM
ncbi:MAG: hypothetical protein OHK0046_08130 [Anaerolineae bacterium]